MILDGGSDPYAAEFLFVGTGSGVYLLDRNAGTWGRVTTANGLPDNEVRKLGLDEGILWVATETGLASADVRVNDWQVYDLPGRVSGLGFDADFAWAGTDSGLWRFDKFGESWEQVADVSVRDVVLDAGRVWLATGAGIRFFDPGFERLEDPGAPGFDAFAIQAGAGRLVFWCRDSGGGVLPVGYDKSGERFARLGQSGFGDTARVGDSVLVADSVVRLLDPQTGTWQALAELADVAVRGIAANGQHLLCATDRGLLVFSWQDRSRAWHTRGSGMPLDSVLDAWEDNGRLYAFGARGIAFQDKATGVWQLEELRAAGEGQQAVFFLDEAGAHARLVPRTDLRLTGRAFVSETRTFSGGAGARAGYENVNLGVVGRHESGRTLSGFYDDSEKEQVLFGASYRGLEPDALQRVNAGRLAADYFEFDVVPGFATLGGNARARAGPADVGVQAGLLQSRFHTEVFSGRTSAKQGTLEDIGFARNVFYLVDSTGRATGPGADTVFVDDRDPATDGIDTRAGFAAGGMVGDFDPLIPGQDYFLDRARGIVRFAVARGPGDVVVLRVGPDDFVLQSDSVRERALVNRYAVGPNVLPGTFELAISDTTGAVRALAEFGLDDDGDGRVDPEFLDHRLGWLEFPARRPFPDEVYEDTLNVFRLDVRFSSRSTFYYLASRPLQKSSETVTVDGEPLTRGRDYVVDYTSGILLFLREDLVSDFSDIEVTYASVARDRDDLLASVQPVLRVADGARVAPGFSRVGEENLVHLSGRFEGAPAGVGVRLVPQAAVTTGREWAQDHELVAGLGSTSISCRYQGYSAGFDNFGAGDRRYGRLRHGATVAAVTEPVRHLRLDGQFQRSRQEDSAAGARDAQYAWARASYLDPDLPNGSVLAGQDNLPDGTRRRLRLNGSYDFELGRNRVRADGAFRTVGLRQAGAADRSQLEYTGELGFSLAVPVHGDLRFRQSDLGSGGARTGRENELRCRLNIDAVPGLFYTGSYDVGQERWLAGGAAGTDDLDAEHRLQSNLNIAPGRWWGALSPVNLTVGGGTGFDEYRRLVPRAAGAGLFRIEPFDFGRVASASRSANLYGVVQFQPLTELVLWARRGLSQSGTGYHAPPVTRPTVEDEVRVEYEPARLGRFAGTWTGRAAETYPADRAQNWSLEWTMPWTDRVRTRLLSNLRLADRTWTGGRTEDRELRADAEVLVRFGSRSFAVARLAGTRQWDETATAGYAVLPGAGLSLNLLRFLYLQLDYASTLALAGTSTHLVSGKLTAQF